MTDIQTELTRDTVSAMATVAASPSEVFDFLRRPANHSIIAGDGSVKGTTTGPEMISAGDKFGMSMRLGIPYRISNKVVEFDTDRRLGWSHMMGHTWRWEIEPASDGGSKVTETFDLSTARAPFLLRIAGFPAKHTENVKNSVAKVAAHFDTPIPRG